jgi:hypothetical protein
MNCVLWCFGVRRKSAKNTVKLCAKFEFLDSTHLLYVITTEMTFFL